MLSINTFTMTDYAPQPAGAASNNNNVNVLFFQILTVGQQSFLLRGRRGDLSLSIIQSLLHVLEQFLQLLLALHQSKSSLPFSHVR